MTRFIAEPTRRSASSEVSVGSTAATPTTSPRKMIVQRTPLTTSSDGLADRLQPARSDHPALAIRRSKSIPRSAPRTRIPSSQPSIMASAIEMSKAIVPGSSLASAAPRLASD
ncbi:MAG: hypothetical protein ABI744_07465 [Chloroflexota bacterium]